jgi:hypothetical protein
MSMEHASTKKRINSQKNKQQITYNIKFLLIAYKSTILIKATENSVLVTLKHAPTLKNC